MSAVERARASEAPVLEVSDLKVHFPVLGGILRRRVGTVFAVDGVNLSIQRGETLGLVGESGCGKSTLGRAVIRLYESTAGTIRFEDQDITRLSQRVLRPLRRRMQMIFQDPYSSLNPRSTVGDILEGPLALHGVKRGERRKRVDALLDRVGLSSSAAHKFPHEFSGGQRQRVGIARAICLNPSLVICDEAVSALDVSVQSQVLNLLLDLQTDLGLSYLFISHDLSVVRHMADRIAVMYLGKIVELTAAEQIYGRAAHPYTRALLSAVPEPDPSTRLRERIILKGDVPSPLNPPAGCGFQARCPHVQPRCRAERPALRHFEGDLGHEVACHFPLN